MKNNETMTQQMKQGNNDKNKQRHNKFRQLIKVKSREDPYNKND